MTISADGVKSLKDLAAVLFPFSSFGGSRQVPTDVPGNINTEGVRMARAQALLAYVSCRFQDEQEKEKASTTITVWLDNERSGQVRTVLHEAHASLLKQGEKAP